MKVIIVNTTTTYINISDEQEKQWVWKGGNDDGDDLPLEVGEEIRLRVANVMFQKQSTSKAVKSNGHVYTGSSGLFAPMVVVVSDKLGLSITDEKW